MFPVVMRIVILVGVLSAIYMALGWYMRWSLARRLDAEHASGEGATLTREDFVAKGLAEYERSWERKLLYGIFALPFLSALLLALFANYG
ncbi:MAG TPA: hypothetical protein VMY41_06375 [Thermohalobaculum sp.]|nr:hypothetical protein [Thermohalobaculum sp.]